MREHFITVSFVNSVREQVAQSPLFSFQAVPCDSDEGLRGTLTQIDDDQVELAVPTPTPSHYVLVARVVRPARAFTQLPVATARHQNLDRREQALVEVLKFSVDWLFRSSTEEHRHPYL